MIESAAQDLGDDEADAKCDQGTGQRALAYEFADMFQYTDILPAIPSYDEMATLRDQMMSKVYTQKESVRNALAEAERLTQALLDADLAKLKTQQK